jgi:hypothetical protein
MADDDVLEGEVDPETQTGHDDWAEFPDKVKRQAANYFASGKYPNDEAIGKAVGAPPMLIRKWRERAEPDGVNWHEMRKARESGHWAVMPQAVAMSPADTADNLMALQGQLLSTCLEALATPDLVDERGEPVPHLYDEKTGKKVPINSLVRPKSHKDIAQIAGVLLRIENLRDTAEERRMMETTFLARMSEALEELFSVVRLTDAQKDRWRDKLQQLQNQGRLPEGALLEVKFKGHD